MAIFRYQHGDTPLEGFTIQYGLGRGGFGEVYYALSDSGREVALKAVQNYEDIELRGIKQCMNLKHQQLVSIFDIKHSAEGLPFVIMEFVDGPSLRDILDSHPDGLGADKAAFFLQQMATGISYLHDSGTVHRDLKPHNVFYENGIVKIGDYSLSKAITTSHRSGHTMTVGTVHYMAPEISHGRYDHTVDIYALGVMLYEMLTGHPPFLGETMGEVLMKHVNGDVDVSRLEAPFAHVVKRAMEKDPDERYQSAQEMMDDLLGHRDLQHSVASLGPESLTMIAEKAVRQAKEKSENRRKPVGSQKPAGATSGNQPTAAFRHGHARGKTQGAKAGNRATLVGTSPLTYFVVAFIASIVLFSGFSLGGNELLILGVAGAAVYGLYSARRHHQKEVANRHRAPRSSSEPANSANVSAKNVTPANLSPPPPIAKYIKLPNYVMRLAMVAALFCVPFFFLALVEDDDFFAGAMVALGISFMLVIGDRLARFLRMNVSFLFVCAGIAFVSFGSIILANRGPDSEIIGFTLLMFAFVCVLASVTARFSPHCRPELVNTQFVTVQQPTHDDVFAEPMYAARAKQSPVPPPHVANYASAKPKPKPTAPTPSDFGINPNASPYSRFVSLCMSLPLFLGIPVCGLQRIYVGRIKSGILWLVTFGLLGIGQLFDVIMIAVGHFKDARGRRVLSFTREKFDQKFDQLLRQPVNEYSAVVKQNWSDSRIGFRLGNVLLNLIGGILLIVALAAGAVRSIDLPGAVAKGVLGHQVQVEFFTGFGFADWHVVAGLGAAVVAAVTGTLAAVSLIFARRESTWKHMLRVVLSAIFFLLALVALGLTSNMGQAWNHIGALVSEGLVAQAISEMVPRISGGLFFGSVCFVLGMFLLAWPAKSRNQNEIHTQAKPQAVAEENHVSV